MIKLFVTPILQASLFFSALLLGPLTIFSQEKTAVRDDRFLPLSEVKEGMKGTAKTVFRGSVPEEFNVEILGILPGGVGPKQDLIIGRISGGNADKTAVFAGMSGSPVHINGKLVGAISYSFPFSKEAICGITPIEQMISIFDRGSEATDKFGRPGIFSFTELTAGVDLDREPSDQIEGHVPVDIGDRRLSSFAGQSFRRIGTPIAFSGFDQRTLEHFSGHFGRHGLLPVMSAGGTAPISPLKKADANTLQGGTSVSMQLTRGDYSIISSGTVTFRDGNKIYAYGHPFLSIGSSDLPMSESSVVAVVSSISNSFKIAVPEAMVGSMKQDRATGVFGILGEAPKMIPVRLNLRSSRGAITVHNFEIVKDEFLTPLLLNITLFNTVLTQERSLGDVTIDISGEVKIDKHKPLKIERRFNGSNASQLAAFSFASPVSALLRSNFEGVTIKGIELNLSAADGSKTGMLERLSVDRSQVKPGEEIAIRAFVRTPDGRLFSQRIPARLPLDTAPGLISITVADGMTLQQASPIQYFVPRDLGDLIDTINTVKRQDRLFLQISRPTKGAIMGTHEMPNLPPSMLATINNTVSSGGIRASEQTVISEIAIAESEFIALGQQTLTLEVVR